MILTNEDHIRKQPSSKRNLLNHFKAIKAAADNLSIANLEVSLDCNNFKLLISSKKQRITLYPQFIAIVDSNKQYRSGFDDESHLFIGWRPYLPQQFSSLFSDKLLFKDFLRSNNISTPNYTIGGKPNYPSLFKMRHSAFGHRIKGPFKENSIPDDLLKMTKAGYFEQFCIGKIIKIWYWGDTPVCFEHQDMPSITGDGINTIENMILERKKLRHAALRTCDCTDILAYQNLIINDVLPAEKQAIIDYRYGSSLAAPRSNQESLFEDVDQKQHDVLTKLGKLVSEIAETSKFAYTIDAILKHDNALTFLECNANPFIHPQVYVEMLSSLFYDEMINQPLPKYLS